MGYSDEFKEALMFLDAHYHDSNVNNNKDIVFSDETVIKECYRFKSMKQSAFKNVVYADSLFENVALTGSSFDNIKYINTKLIGCSFANCNFYNTEINGTRAAFSANNFSQSNFEQCVFRRIKFFRSGILNTVYHRCSFEKIKFRGSILEGSQFVGCNFKNCDFANVNVDYTLFSKNDYDHIVFPFYQIAYVIGAADILRDEAQKVFVKAGEKTVSSKEYLNQIQNLILYYLDKREFFPACNLCITQNNYIKAKEYLLNGIVRALENKNFRMISNFCRLAKYHGIADENIKQKIIRSLNDFIQSGGIPESQLNYYLIYIGNIKNLLNEGASETVTLNYTIRTDVNKNSKDGVCYVNDIVSKLNVELSKLENIDGFEVSITNHSPYEIAVDVITVLIMIPSAVEAVMNLFTKIKNKFSNKYNKTNAKKFDMDIRKKYVDERIERMKRDMLELRKKYKGRELDDHIIEVTQSLKTDLEELYSKDIMICEIKKRT